MATGCSGKENRANCKSPIICPSINSRQRNQEEQDQKEIKRDFSDMEIELTEKEDERGQNKDQTAYYQQNSSQTVENGEREQPASRQ